MHIASDLTSTFFMIFFTLTITYTLAASLEMDPLQRIVTSADDIQCLCLPYITQTPKSLRPTGRKHASRLAIKYSTPTKAFSDHPERRPHSDRPVSKCVATQYPRCLRRHYPSDIVTQGLGPYVRRLPRAQSVPSLRACVSAAPGSSDPESNGGSGTTSDQLR
jgi:hypothetical protein